MRDASSRVALAVWLVVAALCSAATDARSSSLTETSVLAGGCANCHGTDGRSPGSIPAIAGIPYATIKAKLEAFKTNPPSDATVMPRLMRGYDAEQIEQLARHFSNIKPEMRR